METVAAWKDALVVSGLIVIAALVIWGLLWDLLVTRTVKRFKKSILDDVMWSCDRRYARKRRGSV